MPRKKTSKTPQPPTPSVGRPPTYKTVNDLKKRIEEYFRSCWEPVMERKRKEGTEKMKRSELTDDDFEWVQETNWKGEPRWKQVKPYSVTGLCLALGITRQTLLNYEKNDKFFDTIKRAKLVIENYVDEGLMTEDVPAAAGIFNLKNNFGWIDEQTMKHDATESLAAVIASANGGRKQSSKGS